MDRNGFLMLLAILLVALSSGCSSGGENPIIPGAEDRAAVEATGTTVCLGLWQVVIDKNTGEVDVVDLRSSDLIINVLGFMEPPPLTWMDLDWGTLVIDPDNNIVNVDVIFKHPINDPVFMGFDVRGIVFGPELTNADGYTVVCSPEFFSGVPFGYQDGLLGAPDSYAGYEGLAGYKYYCDGLDLDDDLVAFMANSGNLDNRGVFSNGAVNARHYDLDWSDGDYNFLVFNYAIYANYDWPVGDPPIDLQNFDISTANSAEAFCADATEAANSLFYDGASGGGSISLDVEVWDWQGDVADVTIQAGGGSIIPVTSYDADSGGTTVYSHVYSFTDVAGTPTATGDLDILITVTDAKTFGEAWFLNLLPATNSMYDAQVYSCFCHTTTVGEATPSIYVDGDNDTGVEDGSEANPYNTIMEGVNAAGVGDTIEVDAIDGGGEYTQKVTLKSDITLWGSNWNGGTDKPKIRVAWDRYNRMEGNSVSNIVVDGFDLTSDAFYIPWSSGGDNFVQLVYLSECDDVTIKNCRFHAHANVQIIVAIRVLGGSGITIEHNEFVDIYNTRTFNWSIRTTAIDVNGTDGVVVKFNEAHHLNHQSVHNSGDARNTYTYAFYIYNSPSTSITNNLIYDIYDFSTGDAGTDYYRRNIIRGIQAWNCSDAVVANNTIDDVNCVARTGMQAGESYGVYCGDSAQGAESYTVKNNIVSNIVTNEFPLYALFSGHGFNSAFTLTVTYSCVFSLDLGNNGAEYSDLAIKGTGSFDNADNEDPAYDMTPGANYYHVTNSNLVSDDDSEMGAFGGPEGDWTPPSQE